MAGEIEKRIKEMEALGKESVRSAFKSMEELSEKEIEKEKSSEFIPVGSLEPKPGYVKVVSKTSLQEQYIPRGVKKFKDVITGTVEEL